MDNTNITIYVGGRKYKFRAEDLSSGYCQKLCDEIKFNVEKIVYFDRPRLAFEAILDYHTTGFLHMPLTTCPEEFKEELDFWEIPANKLQKCCHTRLLSFYREKSLLRDYKDTASCLEGKYTVNAKTARGRARQKIWNVLSYYDEGFLAKVYFLVSTLFILVSIVGIAISTLPEFRDYNTTAILSPRSQNIPEKVDYCELLYGQMMPRRMTGNATTFRGRSTFMDIFPEPVHTKIPSLQHTMNKGTNTFLYIEVITTSFFTIEQMLRILTCPRIVHYLGRVMNLLEMVLLTASYGRFVLHFLEIDYKGNGWSILLYIQMFRVFRIIRIMRHVTAFRVLNYSIRAGKKDLCIMFLYIFIGLIMFSNLIFFFELTEDFPSIPDSWWWSLITMTTVGYGDMIPKTVAGKILGCICAVSGVIMLSLVIPIFVNTFLFLYQYAELENIRIPPSKKQCDAIKSTTTSADTQVTVDN